MGAVDVGGGSLVGRAVMLGNGTASVDSDGDCDEDVGVMLAVVDVDVRFSVLDRMRVLEAVVDVLKNVVG